MKTKKKIPAGATITPKSDAFRETFVFLFDRKEAQIVRRFGDLLQDRMLDRAVHQERNPGGSFTLGEMLAVTTDFRFLEGFLRGVSAERSLSDLTPTEQSLSELAGRFAPEVAALTERLEQEIQRLISDDEDEQAKAIVEQSRPEEDQ
jgi:hypothetical protein